MDENKNIRMTLQYDGSRYHGWQRQKGVPTIQGVMEDRIRTMIREPVKLIGSGRTDAGVHALRQVCNFRTRTKIDPESLQRGLNSLLPEDILVKDAAYAPLDFHSMYSSKSKTYEYRVLNCREPDLFLRFYTWHIAVDLDHRAMQRCTSLLRGKHDFSAFRSSGSGNRNPVREMMRAELLGHAGGLLVFLFEADGFLRHMVRNIVGTLVAVGRRRMGFDGFVEAIHSKDREKAAVKAPPQGLFLTKVQY